MHAMLLLQMFAEFAEYGGQLPVFENRGVVQVGRLAAKHRQVMQRIENMLPRGVAPLVPSYRLAVDDHLDAIHIGFHCCRTKGERAWHAVAIGVQGDRLVLVHLARLADTIVEAVIRQCDCRHTVLLEAIADGFALACGDARQIVLATFVQVAVQLGQVPHLRYRRGPTALQILHTVLDMWLLVAACRHTEQRLEVVMAGQGLITCVQPPLTTDQNFGGHRPRVVPPQFLRHAAEKLEGCDQAV